MFRFLTCCTPSLYRAGVLITSECKSRHTVIFNILFFFFFFFLLSLSACIFISQVTTRGEAHLELNAFRRKHDCALVISGDSLEVSQRVGHSPPATDFLCPVLCLIHHNRSWKWRLWLESHDQPPWRGSKTEGYALVVPIYS